MDLRLAVTGDLRGFMESRAAVTAGGLRAAAGIGAREGTARYRANVSAGGLGSRLANSVRGVVYPRADTGTLSPAALIYTKAPRLIAAFEDGGTIKPVKGSQFLWIPTENVPRAGRRRMSPGRVEELYGDFEYVPSLLSRGTFLAVVPAVRSRSRTGFRQATAKRRASGRNLQRIVMFVLVKFVTLRKRLDIAGVERQLQADWPEIVAKGLSDALESGGS